jgi:ribosomal protein L4
MVYSVDIYDKSGKVVSKVDLNETLFADTMINPALIHEYYLLQSSNARLPIAKVQGK